MIEKRKQTTIEERVGKCSCCQAISLLHKHHILPFHIHGNSKECYTWLLCANCHDLIHIAASSIIYHKKRATKVWNSFVEAVGKDSKIIKQIEDRVYETADVGFDTAISYSDYD
jgi:hypothetical protein